MARKYLAFDLEIAKEMPDGEDWRAHSPLGISCAGTLTQEQGEAPTLWYSLDSDDTPASQMNRYDSRTLVSYLSSMADSDYTILTWNGLNFDFPILAEESGLVSECKELAAHHVDMMFHFLCAKGHYLGLEAAANGMGLPGKTLGMTGADVPRYWAQGRHQEVLDYLAQDVRTTLDVAHSCEEGGALLWTSQRGNPQGIDLPSGWLTVPEALKLPNPDTSWMSNPPSRGDFTGWLSGP